VFSFVKFPFLFYNNYQNFNVSFLSIDPELSVSIYLKIFNNLFSTSGESYNLDSLVPITEYNFKKIKNLQRKNLKLNLNFINCGKC